MRLVPLQRPNVVVLIVDAGSPTSSAFLYCTFSDFLIIATLAEEETLEKGIETLLFNPVDGAMPTFNHCRLHNGDGGVEEANFTREIDVAWL